MNDNNQLEAMSENVSIRFDLCIDELSKTDVEQLEAHLGFLNLRVNESDYGYSLFAILPRDFAVNELVGHLDQCRLESRFRIFCRVTSELDNYLFDIPENILGLSHRLGAKLQISFIFL